MSARVKVSKKTGVDYPVLSLDVEEGMLCLREGIGIHSAGSPVLLYLLLVAFPGAREMAKKC